MAKGNIYPFRVRINDPELAQVLIMVNKRRATKIPNPGTARRAGLKLKPIRKDVFIGCDNRHYKSFIALPPELDLDIIKKGKGYDFIFKNIF